MEHHPTLAPSSFPALQVCPHFVSRGGEANRFAERGDRIHDLTELILADGTIPPAANKDEVFVAQWMADKTLELLSESVHAVAMGVSIRDPLSGEEITFGTVDCWGTGKGGDGGLEPILIDWKTGYPADYHAQMQIYALGLMDMLEIDFIRCVFVYGDQQKTETIFVSRGEAERLLRDTIRRQGDPEEPFVKSAYCNRCALRPTCPAWTEVALEAIALTETSIDISEGLAVIVEDPKKLGKFLHGWKAIQKLVEDHDVHGAAISFLERGIEVGDFEVKERKGRREYAKDSVQVLLQLIKDGDLDVDKASAMFRLTPDEVDKFFKETKKPCPVNTIVKGTYKILVEKNGYNK